MSGLFGETPSIPEPEPPAPMPDEQDTATARRRRIAKERQMSGYESTILSQGGKETLGA